MSSTCLGRSAGGYRGRKLCPTGNNFVAIMAKRSECADRKDAVRSGWATRKLAQR